MDPASLLVKQRARIDELLDRLDAQGSDPQLSHILELINHLTVHLAIDEHLFYPAAKDVVPEALGTASLEETRRALRLLARAATDPNAFPILLRGLRDVVQEQRVLDSTVLAAIQVSRPRADLAALGEMMTEFYAAATRGLTGTEAA